MLSPHSVPSFEVPCAPPFKVPGDKIWDKFVKFRVFLDPSDQNEQYHTQYYPKYETWSIENKLWDFKTHILGWNRVGYLYRVQKGNFWLLAPFKCADMKRDKEGTMSNCYHWWQTFLPLCAKLLAENVIVRNCFQYFPRLSQNKMLLTWKKGTYIFRPELFWNPRALPVRSIILLYFTLLYKHWSALVPY